MVWAYNPIMKSKKYWGWMLAAGIFIIIAPLISALVTATGAFGVDPGERVNRIDFLWSVIGLAITAFSFYKLRKISKT